MNTSSFRQTWFRAAVFCFASLGASSASAGATRAYTGVDSTLAIDGVSCGQVLSWQDGEIVGELELDSRTGPLQKKHIAGIHYAPITIELSLPPAAPVVTWISDFLNNKSSPKTVTLASFKSDRKTLADAIEAGNASLLEVDFPLADGGSKNAPRLKLVFVAEKVQSTTTAPAPAISIGAAKKGTEQNFHFTLDGFTSGKDVKRVTGIVAKRHVVGSAPGTTREIDLVAQPVEFSNLTVSIAEIRADEFSDWAENFLVKGNNSDSYEKNGSLDFTDSTGGTTFFSLKFSHIGLVRLAASAVTSSTESVREVQAELYFEGLSVSTSDKSGSADPKKDDRTTDTPDPTKGSSDSSSKTTSDDSKSGTTTKDAGSGDQGAGDPANFPRIDGLTRKTFLSTCLPASSEESATYASKNSSADVVSAYNSALKSAGWEQTLRNESGDPASGSHQVRLRWARKSDSADVRLTDAKSGGTDVNLTVSSSHAGSLPGINPKTKSPAVAEKGSSGDQGARDPADIPRPAGSIRKSFTSLGLASAPQETATYTAKLPIDQLEAFYVKTLPPVDWEETSRRELGDPASGSHQVTLKWSKGSRSATIALTETSAEVTQIEVNVFTAVR